jgi:hypothetical protein
MNTIKERYEAADELRKRVDAFLHEHKVPNGYVMGTKELHLFFQKELRALAEEMDEQAEKYMPAYEPEDKGVNFAFAEAASMLRLKASELIAVNKKTK